MQVRTKYLALTACAAIRYRASTSSDAHHSTIAALLRAPPITIARTSDARATRPAVHILAFVLWKGELRAMTLSHGNCDRLLMERFGHAVGEILDVRVAALVVKRQDGS